MLTLTSASGSLTLTVDSQGEGGWCRVELVTSDAARPLGAERLSYVATRLTSFLQDASPGHRWVFSLSELHTSAYGEHYDGTVTLELQDASAITFAVLTLSPAERTEWLDRLP